MSNKYKILLIEDEINISNFVKTILVTNGYQVVEVQNGAFVVLLSLSQFNYFRFRTAGY